MSRRIAVLFGGDSEERDVSAASAAQIVAALRRSGHDVLAVDTAFGALRPADETLALSTDVPRTPPGRSALLPTHITSSMVRLPAEVADVDLVFLALHGGSGENGRVQSLLDLAGIPYTGSGPLGSAMAMDKDISKRIFRAAGIRTPDWLTSVEDAPAMLDELGLPLIVKPNSQGSTVGLSLVRSGASLAAAVRAAGEHGEILYERFVPGREITVGVLGEEALAVGEILIDPNTAFGYSDKYQPGAVHEVFPADLPSALTHEAQQTALAAHRALKLEGYSRSDFRLDDDGRLWLIEVNTLPGMTMTSLMPQSAQAAGVDYAALCERISDLALERGRS